MAKGTLWPRMTRGLPSGPYLPMRGPRILAPQNEAMPPVMWTMVEPAKSWNGVSSWSSQPPPHTQRTTTG